MDKFTIIANGAENRRGKNQAVARKIADYLEKHRKVCVILPAGEKKEGQSYSYTDPERIPGGTECIIVLGGDGTLLQAARDVVDLAVWYQYGYSGLSGRDRSIFHLSGTGSADE